MTGVTFDLDAFLDSRRLSAMHVKVIVLLLLTMLIDGYDIFAVGYVLPVLAKGLKVAPHALTATLVLQQAGLLAGAVVMGPLADRFGRKTTMLSAIACFAVCSLLTTQVHTLTEFTVIRVISSVFFSGVIPNTISLASEIAPRRMRAAAVSITFCGYTGGSLIGSAVQAWVLKPFGWQGAFWVGGILPILIFVLLAWQLPESLRFRARRNPRDPKIAQALRKLDPDVQLTGDESFIVQDSVAKAGRKVAAGALFQGRLLPMTMLLWTAYVMGFMVSHVLGSWNTTVLNTVAGIPMEKLSIIIAVSATAGIIGTGTSGFVMDRFGAAKTLTFYFLGEAAALTALGLADIHSPAIMLVFMAASYFNAASLGGLNALAAILYPPQIRATGVAWASGAGRAGAMLGPLFGGFMLGRHFGLTPIYLTIAVPGLIAALCMFGMWRLRQREVAQVEELVAEPMLN